MASRNLPTLEAAAALLMAEALSCAVRDDTGAEALERLRSFADDDTHALTEARRRCLAFSGLDHHTRQTAASLLERVEWGVDRRAAG